MKNKSIAIFIATSMCLVTACSNRPQTSGKLDKLPKGRIELDEYSIHQGFYESDSIPSQSTQKSNSNAEMQGVGTDFGEIVVDNVDNANDEYIVDGDDILIGEKRFVGLNKAEQSINHPYTRDQFLNIIVRATYREFNSNRIEIEINTENNTENNSDDAQLDENTSMSIEDNIGGDPNYERVKSEHNGKRADWELTFITDDQVALIAGCDEYMLVGGSGLNIKLDFSEVETYGVPQIEKTEEEKIIDQFNEQTEESAESAEGTDENTEQAEESAESAEKTDENTEQPSDEQDKQSEEDKQTTEESEQ